MTHVFENLKTIKKDMEDKGWVIESFYFRFKNQNYIVLVKSLEENEKAPIDTLVKLEFLKENDFSYMLTLYADDKNFLELDVKSFRNFFGIEYSNNLGDIIKQFKQIFASFIPTKVNDDKDKSQKDAMWHSLSESDSEDPRKKYCISVSRNGKKKNGELKQRSPYNDNKTRLYRPSLYERVGNDTNISFDYSIHPEKRKSDEHIIKKMIDNQNK